MMRKYQPLMCRGRRISRFAYMTAFILSVVFLFTLTGCTTVTQEGFWAYDSAGNRNFVTNRALVEITKSADPAKVVTQTQTHILGQPISKDDISPIPVILSAIFVIVTFLFYKSESSETHFWSEYIKITLILGLPNVLFSIFMNMTNRVLVIAVVVGISLLTALITYLKNAQKKKEHGDKSWSDYWTRENNERIAYSKRYYRAAAGAAEIAKKERDNRFIAHIASGKLGFDRDRGDTDNIANAYIFDSESAIKHEEPVNRNEGKVIRDLHGNLTARTDGNIIRDIYGNILFRIDGNNIRDIYGGLTHRIDGNVIRDIHGNLTHHLDGNTIRDINGNIIARVEYPPQ